MIKNSVRKKERDWEWRQVAVPTALGEQWPTAGKVCALWRCHKYAVLTIRFPDETVLLMVNDPTCRHSWQDLQRIKNDLLGERWAAVEVYPPQDRVVDEANLYHLWCTFEQLKIGWDDGGEYTVRHTFYAPKGDEDDHGLPEIVRHNRGRQSENHPGHAGRQ